MSDLVAFLNARLDEDQAKARTALQQQAWLIDNHAEPVSAVLHDAQIIVPQMTRLVREAKAKRRILDWYTCDPPGMCSWHGPDYLDKITRLDQWEDDNRWSDPE